MEGGRGPSRGYGGTGSGCSGNFRPIFFRGSMMSIEIRHEHGCFRLFDGKDHLGNLFSKADAELLVLAKAWDQHIAANPMPPFRPYATAEQVVEDREALRRRFFKTKGSLAAPDDDVQPDQVIGE